MNGLVVAYYIVHNEGVEQGIIKSSDEMAGFSDLFEVDGEIMGFNSVAEAEAWLIECDEESA